MLNERLKDLRLYSNLSQEEFGNRIGIKSRGHISTLESGAKKLTDRIISDIVREFSVNEAWLRYGEGEMLEKLSRDEELAMSIGRILAEENDFTKNVFLALSRLDPTEWKVIEKLINDINKKNE